MIDIVLAAVIGFATGVAIIELWREASHRWNMRRITKQFDKRPDTATPTQWCVVSGCEGVVVRGECPDCGYCQDAS